MPEDQARPGQVLDGEQVELLAQQAVVAALGFLNLIEIILKIFLREERSAVDALELGILLVAQPVGARDVQQLEGLDLAGGGDVGPAAEVEELAGLVDGDALVGLGELLDEVDLHEIALGAESLQGLVARQELARIRFVALYQLLHFLFDLFQVLGSERLFAVEVVEEAVLGRRAVAELGFRKQFQDGGGHEVGRGVAVDREGIRITVGQDAQLGVGVERASQVDQVAVGLGRQRSLGQPRADGFRDVQRGGAFRNLLGAAIGQLDGDHVCHVGTCHHAKGSESKGATGEKQTMGFHPSPKAGERVGHPWRQAALVRGDDVRSSARIWRKRRISETSATKKVTTSTARAMGRAT